MYQPILNPFGVCALCCKTLIVFLRFTSSTSERHPTLFQLPLSTKYLKNQAICLTVDLHLKTVHQKTHLSTEPQLEQFSAFFSTTGKLTWKQSNQSSSDRLLSYEGQSTQASKKTSAFSSTLQEEKQKTR